MKRRRDGFILVAALGMLVAFSAMALYFGLSARTQRLAVNNASEQLIAVSAAEGAFVYARSALEHSIASGDTGRSSSHVRDPWQAFHGTADTLNIAVATAVIRYWDAGSMAYPAAMRDESLRAFFRAVESDSLLADSAASTVRLSTLGVDVALPGCLGAGWGIDARVTAGMTARVEAVIDRALPMMACVGAARTNVQTAPRSVLMSLPGVGAAAASAIIARRSDDRLGGVLDISPDLSVPDRAWFLSQVPLLLAVATSGSSAMIVRIDVRATPASHPLLMECVLLRVRGVPITVWRRIV